jgi:rhodanese-related sulfurtransferase/rubrerythrin
MDLKAPINLDPQQLQRYIDTLAEQDYILIDVRQPQEYALSHIPGARLMPLLEFEAQLFDLPSDKELVFYCRNGGRSLAAAALAVEAEVSQANIYHLSGGLMAWYGKTLADYPRIQVFDPNAKTEQKLRTAMDLEKGAWRFYQHVRARFADRQFSDTFENLAQAETAHARTIYTIWRSHAADGPSFEQMFDDLQGHIIEGGQSLEEVIDRLPADSKTICIDLVEFALQIEYAAFDLYRVLGDQHADDDLKSAFLALAQAEKGHMRMLSQTVAVCDQA